MLKPPSREAERCVLQGRMTKLGDLSNDELLARLRTHVGRGSVWLVGLLAYLGELDARRLYAEHACTSTWDFCIRKLGMSESEAQRRIAVARVLRAFPLARTYLERGNIHLCAIYSMHKHITKDNHEELLREAAGKTTKEVAAIIARRFPKPDVHSCIEPLAPQPVLPLATDVGAPASSSSPYSTPSVTTMLEMWPRLEPLSATRYRVALTISHETKEKIERIRELMRHRNPSGDLEKIVDASIDLLLTKLQKERFAKTSRKAKRRATAHESDGINWVPPKDGSTADRAAATTCRDVAALSVDGTNGLPPTDRSTAERAAATTCRDVTLRVDGANGVPPKDRCTAERAAATTSRPGERTTTHEHDAPPAPPAAGATAQKPATSSQRAIRATAGQRHPTSSLPEGATTPQRDAAACSIPAGAAFAQSETDDDGLMKPSPVETTARRRHVPRAIRREVAVRDGEQCSYVDADGNRCPARGFLELDHIDAKALGGSDESANLRLRCRTHNRLHAEQVFGRDYVAQRIDLRRRKSAAAHAPAFDTAARGLRSLGFREAEVRDAIARLTKSLDPGASVESIIREALMLLT